MLPAYDAIHKAFYGKFGYSLIVRIFTARSKNKRSLVMSPKPLEQATRRRRRHLFTAVPASFLPNSAALNSHPSRRRTTSEEVTRPPRCQDVADADADAKMNQP